MMNMPLQQQPLSLWRESDKREIGEREYEKKEIGEK
jgi:hypothetical protein